MWKLKGIRFSKLIKNVTRFLRKTHIFTLKNICEAANISIPEEFANQAEIPLPAIKCFGSRIKEGEALFIRGLLEDGRPASRNYNESSARTGFNNGARFIFSKEQYYTSDGEKLPCIIVDDPKELFITLCQIVRRSFPKKLRTVAVTGSIGKTTTKDMLALIAAEKYRTETSHGNSNGFGSIAAIMQRIKKDTEVYIQEVGAYFPDLIEQDARILAPNACVVTNIGTSHIDLYGSIENIAHDKLALARHLTEGGMTFLNFDDALLRKVNLDCAVTWFSAENPDADYYAANIRVVKNMQEFDVVSKKSTVHIRLMNIGYHNIINAVVAVAFGHWLGLSNDAIAAALAKFKTTGIRQNLIEVGGFNVFVDCFNSSPISLEAAIKTILRIDVPVGNQRIAVLGDMLKMGGLSEQLHADTGRNLVKYDIDLYLCYGPYMRHMAESLSRGGRNVLYTNSREQLHLWLEEHANYGDLILFKSGHRMYLTKTVDAFLGTAFYLTDEDVNLARGVRFETSDFTGCIVEGQASIRKYIPSSPSVTIPSKIQDATVYRIHENAFAKNRTLTELMIQDGLRNIGFAAFYCCNHLKKVVLPNSLKIIEKSGFNSCTRLEQLILPESVTSIGGRAFYNCVSLKKLYVGDNVQSIGPDAFKRCSTLTVYGHKNTYIEKVCQAEGIPFCAVENHVFASNFSE